MGRSTHAGRRLESHLIRLGFAIFPRVLYQTTSDRKTACFDKKTVCLGSEAE
ncbi:hypothetical protein DPMN_083930 [Dreissena polymorpha]|uniref:Uncharacterized protein n=1 Tax=Dreissena polymorpha TaxID=45954 RepID=A0A9D3YDI0_DREPO|nr:hypothetical protein DPMN_083930 [Dreissena polymorpha]